MSFYLYLVSTIEYISLNILKLGLTEDVHARISTYLTGCPPGLTPNQDLEYYMIYEVNAEDTKELHSFEQELHDKFSKNQMITKDRKSEWFNFNDNSKCIEEIDAFITSRDYFKRKFKFEEIPKTPKSILETQSYNRNWDKYIRNPEKRNQLLCEKQFPVINKLFEFITGNETAGQLVSPCGSGKTYMTCEAIRISKIKKMIICVPNQRIQQQWAKTLNKPCKFLGGINDYTKDYIYEEEFCVITTYCSCKKLFTTIPITTELIVFDEAHHMAGIISNNSDSGEGITRVLLDKIINHNMKRLFVTFTPKDILCNTDEKIMSMNDEIQFGNTIAELKLRDMIDSGILPDYRIWALRSENDGIDSKIQQVKYAWNSKVINHLIIFVNEIEEKKHVKKHFNESDVLIIYDSSDTKKILELFEQKERAVLIDCRRIGEGVDIPIADSVAILNNKSSQIDIIQTLLRAGRWYKNKSLFHILLPETPECKLSNIYNVLIALASIDEGLRSELLTTKSEKVNTKNSQQIDGFGINEFNNHVSCDIVNSTDIEKIKYIAEHVRSHIIHRLNSLEIRERCISEGIDTFDKYTKSVYYQHKQNPVFSHMSNYEYFNPTKPAQLTIDEFVKYVIDNCDIRNSEAYELWQRNNQNYPSLGNISDGYFKNGNHTTILDIIDDKRSTRMLRR
jgi:superfamily II DNA or RNA helicase